MSADVTDRPSGDPQPGTFREDAVDARRYRLLRSRWVRAYGDDRKDKEAEFVGTEEQLDAQLDEALRAAQRGSSCEVCPADVHCAKPLRGGSSQE
jgi:hypothetical protein